MILGNSKNINVEQFQQELEVIKREQDDVEIIFKDKPNKQEFNQLLADEIGRDIFIFAGHSETQNASGILFINEDENDNSITINELEDPLKIAINNGLSLAIFNSCDGLGLANDLANLNLPEIIVMREPVAQKVALEFFKHFLEHFIRQRKGLYVSVKEAKQALKELENEFPCASWLPIICQNPTVEPPSWIYLGGIPPCPYRGLSAFREKDAPLFFGRDKLIQEILNAVNDKPLVTVVGASGSGKSSAVFAGLIPDWRQNATKNLPREVISFRPAFPYNNPYKNLAIAFLEYQVLNIKKRYELNYIYSQDTQANYENLRIVFSRVQQDIFNSDNILENDDYLNSNNQNDDIENSEINDKLKYLELEIKLVDKLANKLAELWEKNNELLSQKLSLLVTQNVPKELLLVIDQFEELYTLCPKNKKESFLSSLVTIINAKNSLLTVVLTLRNDFMGRLIEYSDLGKLLKKYQYQIITEMTTPKLEEAIDESAEEIEVVSELEEAIVKPAEEIEVVSELEEAIDESAEEMEVVSELEQAIVKPAKKMGIVLEKGLAQIIIQDYQQNARNLPILEFTLTQLWQNQKQGVLSIDAYQELGSVQQALAKYADEVYSNLTPAEKELTKWIFIQLVKPVKNQVQPDEENRYLYTRCIATEDNIGKENWDLVTKFADKRLVVTNENQVISKNNQITRIRTVELIHEILIEEWLELKQWVTDESEFRLWQEKLRSALTQWQDKNKDKGALLRGALLDEAKDWLSKHPQGISSQEQNFIQKSLKLRKDSKIVKITSSIMVGLLAGGLFWQFNKYNEQKIISDKEKTIRSLNEKAAEIKNMLTTRENVRGLVLAIQTTGESIDKLEKVIPTVESSLSSAVAVAREKNIFSTPRFEFEREVLEGLPQDNEAVELLQGILDENFKGENSEIFSVAFSPDGKYIVGGGNDNLIYLWDLQGNKIGKSFLGHYGFINSVAFSPDGKYIVSGSDDKTIRLWDLQGNQISPPFIGHEKEVKSVAFSPNGKYIVSGSDDKTIRLWDLQGNQISPPFIGHEKEVKSVAFSPNGQYIVSGSDDKTIRLWDLQGNPIGEPFKGHEKEVQSVAFSPDGQYIVSGSWDKTIRLWDLQGNPIGEPFKGHGFWVKSVKFSPDGQYIASGSDDNTIRLWDLQGNQIGEAFFGHQGGVNSVALSPDGKHLVSSSRDKTIRLWDQKGNQIGKPFIGHQDRIESVAYSPDGQYIASGSKDYTIRLWDQEGNQIGEPFVGHQDRVESIAFSPDGKYIVSGSRDRTIRLWDLEGNQIGKPFIGHEDYIFSVAFSPDGKYIASGGYDTKIRLWDLEGNQIGKPFVGHSDSIFSLAFSPDGKYIASGSWDKTIRLWDLEGNQIGKPFIGHKEAIESIAFSPDGQYLASSSHDLTIRLWDLEGNEISEPFVGHSNRYIFSVRFSPDGKYIVSGGYDWTMRLWDLEGNQIGEPFKGHQGGIYSVAFSPDGQYIVSGSDDRTIRLWRYGWEYWLEVGCNRLRYHPIFQSPQDDIASEAKNTCQEYVWKDTN